mmetsp:Transcript_22858/g.53332  ORF Transcript_22858/g.53332 Transcript_22858/m.53332 type:complete len:186 (+) Transcript_22858:3-560(+)
MTGTGTAGTDTKLILSGPGSGLFGYSGAWTQNTGSLVLTVNAGQAMPSNTPTVFSLEVVNSLTAQTAVTVSARAGGWVPIAPTNLAPAVLAAVKPNPCNTNNGDCTNTCTVVNELASCAPCGKGYTGDGKKSGSGCSEVFEFTLRYTPSTYNQTKFMCELAALLTEQGTPLGCNDFTLQGQPVFS